MKESLVPSAQRDESPAFGERKKIAPNYFLIDFLKYPLDKCEKIWYNIYSEWLFPPVNWRSEF